MGAWIEILLKQMTIPIIQSHPLWVRGLKLPQKIMMRSATRVAPFMGAWIEIHQEESYNISHIVAPFYGCVD